MCLQFHQLRPNCPASLACCTFACVKEYWVLEKEGQL